MYTAEGGYATTEGRLQMMLGFSQPGAAVPYNAGMMDNEKSDRVGRPLNLLSFLLSGCPAVRRARSSAL